MVEETTKTWLRKVREELNGPPPAASSGGFWGRFSKAPPKPQEAPESADILSGSPLESYLFGPLLGIGSAGVVYSLIEASSGEDSPYAVKVLEKVEVDPGDTQNADLFHRELEIGARLNHPAITRTIKVVEAETARLLILERVDGQTFEHLQASKLDVDRYLQLFRPLAEGLQYAHDQGVVHRDLKPENVMLSADGSVKILDFGMARASGSKELTMTGQFKGTPMYCAPEQIISSKNVGPACDQFSFALMSFQALTGGFPYPLDAKQPMQTLFARLQQTAIPLREVSEEFSQPCEDVFAKMLEIKPEDRYGSVLEAFTALESALRG